jgi:hypothetical protein
VPAESVDGEVKDNDGHSAGLMVIERLLSEMLFLDIRIAIAQLSVARTVKFHVPAADEVPVIKPDELMSKPDGNAPEIMLKVIGACPPDVPI